jgi:hypothetical protein
LVPGDGGEALLLPADDPLVLCANELTGEIRIAIAAIAAVADDRFMEVSFSVQQRRHVLVPGGTIATGGD